MLTYYLMAFIRARRTSMSSKRHIPGPYRAIHGRGNRELSNISTEVLRPEIAA